jgi:molybdate transport system ATP-binding protein
VSHRFDEVLRLATHIVLMQSGTVVAQGGIGAISLDARLRPLIGPDAVGAVLEGVALGTDPASGLTRVRVAGGELNVQSLEVAPGTGLRVQLLARDLIVSTQMPQHLSVRNNLKGVVTAIIDDDAGSDLIAIDIGGAHVLARVTKAATREIELAPGLPAWALVKSVSLRGHSFTSAVYRRE